MRKFFIITSALFLIGCGSSDKDCNCTQQRWERKATYTIALPPAFISATDWEKVGNPSSANTDDCSKNGSISQKGDADSWPNTGNNTQTVLEYEYRVTCQ